MNKDELRRVYKQKRSELTPLERELKSREIAQNFFKILKNRPEIETIHIFLPIKRLAEIDTFPMLQTMQQLGYSVYTSMILENGYMDILDISNLEEFEEDSWGIPLPVKKRSANQQNIDLVLIPLLVFDEQGHRIGYGKGYYDRFLEQIGRDVLKVGLSFFEPLALINNEIHDIKLDFCITPQKVHEF